ncbi:MAG: ribonuclease HII [Candidatus Saccharibacteria bacterium]
MIVVGIDEVGRGCWAGPLVAGAVILGQPIKGLRDSKKLSRSRREELAVQIEFEAVAIGLGWVDPATIDSIGLTAAVGLAMERAVAQIRVDYDEIIIDGSYNFLAHRQSAKGPKITTLVRADDLIPAVSAASIMAKVARDNYMYQAALQYPGYGFERHVGYGTALHSAQLKLQGVTPEHRLSYKPIITIVAGAAGRATIIG